MSAIEASMSKGQKLQESTGRIWIAWENHRRSVEIADKLGAELFVFTSRLQRPIKYFPLIFGTIIVLFKRRKSLVFCQNPSLLLAFLVLSLRRILQFRVVVDRHTNFKLATLHNRELRWRIFHALSRYTVKQADLTIVTNDFLASLVTEWSGRPFVLPDPIPNIAPKQGKSLEKKQRPRVTWVSTYSGDEPVEEVLQAAKASDRDFELFITSKPPAEVVSRVIQLGLSERVHLTGFLPTEDYYELLATSDVVMVLTTLEHCLTCGAYEATALGRPMILSDTDALRTHFSKGAIYVQPYRSALASSFAEALDSRRELGSSARELKSQLAKDWEVRRLMLETMLARLCH